MPLLECKKTIPNSPFSENESGIQGGYMILLALIFLIPLEGCIQNYNQFSIKEVMRYDENTFVCYFIAM